MPAHNSKIKVFIADDHAIVRQGLKQILSETSNLVVVGEAESGKDVLKKIRDSKVDVLLMDYDMPGKNGLDVLIELKNILPHLPVIIISIFPEEYYGTRFLKAGASGYLTKGSAPEQVIEAIKTVYCGGNFISPNLTAKLVSGLKKDSAKLPHEFLSDREFQVFIMIASGKRLKIIAEELSLSVNTVSTHRTRILEKLELQSNSDLTYYAVKNGLIN